MTLISVFVTQDVTKTIVRNIRRSKLHHHHLPYKGEKYRLPEFRQGPGPSGKKEVFNRLHSSLRNVIERTFGILKEKWRILKYFPCYPMKK
jgi:hypothetical protein